MDAISTSQGDRGKLVAAIVAGVSAYLSEEATGREAPARPATPRPVLNLWSLSGRQEVMRMRTLWQRRMA